MRAYPTELITNKEDAGLIAICRIEETVEDIQRHNGYSAERAAQAISHFAHGYSDFSLRSKASQAVVDKIAARVEEIASETGLRRQEIHALMQMLCDTDFSGE